MVGFLISVGLGRRTVVRRRAAFVAAASKGSQKGGDGDRPKESEQVSAASVKGKQSQKGVGFGSPTSAGKGKSDAEIMAKYGVYKKNASDVLQRNADQRRRMEETPKKSNYETLVSIVGIEGIGRFEKLVTIGSALFCSIVILCGIGIAYEAFQKTTGGEVPSSVDNTLVEAYNTVFTPALLLFFLCSTSLGLLKSAQIDTANRATLEELKGSGRQ